MKIPGFNRKVVNRPGHPPYTYWYGTLTHPNPTQKHAAQVTLRTKYIQDQHEAWEAFQALREEVGLPRIPGGPDDPETAIAFLNEKGQPEEGWIQV